MKKNKNQGFTLIEVVTVTAILVIISGSIAGILNFVLRINNKAKIASSVSQAGNQTISLLTDLINSSVEIKNMSTYCQPVPASSNAIELIGMDGGTTLLNCTATNNLASNSAYLIDSSVLKVTNCYFKCTQSNIFSNPIIEIGFDLSEVKTGFIENNAKGTFKSSVSMRNYNAR